VSANAVVPDGVVRDEAVRDEVVRDGAVHDEVARNTVVRIERGEVGPEELAAITAVLLARAAAQANSPAARRGRSRAGWRTPGHRAPHSWQG
jgi:hypothetical protein